MTETIYAEEFVTKFSQLAARNFEVPEEEHLQLEKLGKALLREGYNSSKKPNNATYGLWNDMKFYLMDLSQTEIKGKNLMILGFLPSMFMVYDGEITDIHMDLSKKTSIEQIMFGMFKHLDIVSLQIANFVVTHDQLTMTNPENVYELFSLIPNNKKVSASWKTDNMHMGPDSASLFYLPFVLTIPNDVPEHWHFSDIYDAYGMGMMSVENIDTVWEFYNPIGDSDFDANLQTGKPGAYQDVIEDSETDRDLANIEMRLTEIKEYLNQHDKSLNLNISLEVFWPIPAGEILPRDASPILRLSLMVQKDETSEIERHVYKVHVPKFAGGEWQIVMTRVLTTCYELGFGYVQVMQEQVGNLLTAWQQINESKVIH